MRNTEWPPNEIKIVAGGTGKPLEVSCAEAFLREKWKARLGSYFTDGALDTVRELDVIAEKEHRLASGILVRVRALVSCRGFPSDRSPLAYSVSQSSVPSFTPRLLTGHRAPNPWAEQTQTFGQLPDVEEGAAAKLLRSAGLLQTRPLVAFDMIERSETMKKNGDTQISFSQCKGGDRQLFSAVDSSIKAAAYWTREDYSQKEMSFAALNIPVCVLGLPFWDACIDAGKLSDPVVGTRGYQVSLMPVINHAQELVVLIWTVEEISHLITALDDVTEWFVVKIEKLAV